MDERWEKTIIIKEDELQLSINELEAKEIELQKATIELQQHLAELQEYNIYHDDLNPEVKQEDIISTNNRRWRPCG